MSETPDRNSPGSRLRDFLRLVRRYWVTIALATVLVPAVAVALSLRQHAMYESTAAVMLSRQDLASNLEGLPSAYQTVEPARDVATQAQLARARIVAERTIKAADVPYLTPGLFLARSYAAQRADADLIDVAVKDPDPAVAQRLTAAYARQFVNYSRELATAALRRARLDVQARIKQLEAADQQHSALYGTLVRKEEQIATLEALQTSNVAVVQDAGTAVKVSPKPVKYGVLGLFAGVLLGLALAAIRRLLDTRIRSGDEVEELLGVPLLARIPAPPRRLSGGGLITLDEPTGVGAEAYRILRTALKFALLDHPDARVLMLTSSIEGEGKTTTAANLAVALAEAGQRVTLVGLDLRRPGLQRFFDLPPERGLTTVVLGDLDLQDALVNVDLNLTRAGRDAGGNLRVLPTGPIPPRPGEFVGLNTIGHLIDELRADSDIVILDTPPVLRVGDAMLLSTAADAVLLLARMDLVSRAILKELRRALTSAPIEVLGVALTGADAEDGYGYAYGYGYAGYGNATNGDDGAAEATSGNANEPTLTNGRS